MLTHAWWLSRRRADEFVDADAAVVKETGNAVGGVRGRKLNEPSPVPEDFQQRNLSRTEPLAPALRAGSAADQPYSAGISGHPAGYGDRVEARNLRCQAERKGGAQPGRAYA
jgi:hypothetical protein